MSWNAILTDDRGHDAGWWNYTHNTNRMIDAALGDERETSWAPVFGACWWDRLNGMDGPAGAALLAKIIRRLEADPGRYGAMNPENGWGSYDGLLGVLREMRDAVPEWPTVWEVSG